MSRTVDADALRRAGAVSMARTALTMTISWLESLHPTRSRVERLTVLKRAHAELERHFTETGMVRAVPLLALALVMLACSAPAPLDLAELGDCERFRECPGALEDAGLETLAGDAPWSCVRVELETPGALSRETSADCEDCPEGDLRCAVLEPGDAWRVWAPPGVEPTLFRYGQESGKCALTCEVVS